MAGAKCTCPLCSTSKTRKGKKKSEDKALQGIIMDFAIPNRMWREDYTVHSESGDVIGPDKKLVGTRLDDPKIQFEGLHWGDYRMMRWGSRTRS